MSIQLTRETAIAGKTRRQGLSPSRSLLGLTALSLAVGGAVNSYAQESKSSEASSFLEEIIVTATRRAEGLQSIPASIAAVTAADLENKGITNFADITQAVAGLYLEQSSNMTNSSLRIRGVGTSGNSPTAPSVGVIVDGVYQVRKGAAFTELLDLERIEVLRGPQGTNFGKNTTAGVIAIHTKAPDTEEFSARVQGVAGNLDNAEFRGMVNIPLIEGKLAARISGYMAERDGYTENVFVGEDTRNMDREGGRVKLLWNTTDDLTVKISAEHLNQKSRMDQALVEYDTLKLGSRAFPYSTWYGIFGAGSPPPIGLGKAQQQHSETEDTVDRYVMNIRWDIANHTLTSITGYEEIETFLDQDRDRSTLDIMILTSNPQTDILTQEIQLASDFEGPFSYIVGAFYQNEKLFSDTLINGRSVSLTKRDIDSQAVFGSMTYDISEQLSAVVGVRWSEDEKTNNRLGIAETFDEVTYSAKLLYQLDSNKMVYFSHDKGFKSGGINRLVPGGDESFRVWDPEVTYNYEIGLKSEWMDNRLRFNAALFYQTYEDYQVNTSIEDADGNVSTLVTNAAETTSQGIEADFSAALTENLTVNGSVAWIQTEYDDYENAPCPTPTFPGCVNGSQDLSGEQLNDAPKLTYSLGAEYREALPGSDVEWFARADASYRDDTKLGARLSDIKQDSYALYSARLGLESEGKWKLTFWGKNLSDEEYAFAGGREEFGVTLIQGLPRTYGLTADWFF